MQRINLHLTKQQVKALRQVCRSTGLSLAELVRRAIDAYLSTLRKEAGK